MPEKQPNQNVGKRPKCLRPETIKLLEENIGRTPNDINQSKARSSMTHLLE